MCAVLFSNPHADIKPTLYYSITIPLEPFNSGFEWDPQPLNTEFRLEFLELATRDWRDLEGRAFTLSDDQSDCSIYLDNVHNPIEVHQLTFGDRASTRFRVHADLLCLFEDASVGQNAVIVLDTELEYEGLFTQLAEGSLDIETSDLQAVRAFLSTHVDLNAYDPELQIDPSSPMMYRNSLLLKPTSK